MVQVQVQNELDVKTGERRRRSSVRGPEAEVMTTILKQSQSSHASKRGMSKNSLAKQKVWVPSTPDKVFEMGYVDGMYETRTVRRTTKVKTISGNSLQAKVVLPANPSTLNDITKLLHINEATVLHNIEARSLEGKPCTWMGPVLMCVNPLQQTEEPESGDPTISRDVPHPYSLAEEVVSQMQFFRNHGGLRSQSIVISGESGSGKTVSAKKILDHFIKRLYIPEWGEVQDSDEKDASLDVKLLETNPILEAFGNAVTLRNGNSSRFGKFFRLHIDDDGFIIGASLDTYLLERSRVSSHVAGERSFHVFYQLLKGCEPDLRAELQLDSEISSYRYLQNHPDAGTDAFTSPYSAASFQRLCTAFRRVQLEDEEVKNIFRLLAGIMHLGNVEFIAWRSDDESKATRGSAPALANAATLWGLSSPDHLEDLFCEKTIYIGPEKAKITLSAQDAGKARDAIAKEVYSLLFNWICSRINESIKPEKSMATDWNILTGVSIGVLDIFGFESYERNDYEQLLINFANEKLHHLFTVHILQSEADLYLREGLTYASLLWDKQNFAHKPASLKYNTDSINLVRGIMQLIDEESRRLNASELNLNSSIQERYKNSTRMKPVHPRKRQTCFTVIHFAGSVTYTVGNFLEKNDDSLPKETTTVLSNANNVLMPLIFEPRRISHRGGERGSVIRNKNSVAKKFATQMNDLIDTLDATNCSFVRCIKPNPKMRRNGAEEWFDRRYVMFQLKSLGITHAALTLRDGMPLRLGHAEAIDMFHGVFNVQGVESTFMSHGESSKARFVDAAMFAFDINRIHYRVGSSLVFFDVECVELVERAMFDAKTWGENPDSKDARAWSMKFSKFLIQRRWKRAFLAIQFALRLSLSGRNFRPAAVAIQRNVRRMLAVNTYKRYRKAALICQKYFRGAKGRAKAIFMIDLASKRAAAEEAALVRQRALEASLAAEAALRDAVEEIKAKALAREKEEEERVRKEEEEMQAEKQREEEKRAKAEEQMQQRIERAQETERAAMEETAARVRAKARAKAKVREKAARARRAARARAAEKRAQRAQEAEENAVMKVTKAAEEESKAKLKRLAEAEDEANRVEATRRPSAYERVRKKSIVVLDERKFEEAIDRVIQREEEREDKVAASYRETEITLGVQSQDSQSLEQDTSSLSTSKIQSRASSVSSAKAREMEDTDSIQTNSTNNEAKRKRKRKRKRKGKKKKVKPVTLATIACKLAVKSQSNWKERYFVLNTEGLYINYYVQHHGKPTPKKSVKFQINPPDYNPPPKILYSHEEIQLSNLKAVFKDGKIPGLQSKFVRMVTNSRIPGRFFLKIEGGVLDNDPLREIRSLYIAFDRFQDMKQWREAIQDALDQAPQDLYKNGPDIGDHHSIVSFGEQVRCKNFRCSALNNTLYGKLCLECGSYLFDSPSPSI